MDRVKPATFATSPNAKFAKNATQDAQSKRYIWESTVGHRELFKEILDRAGKNTLQELDTDNDLYTLGLHLYFEHGITEQNGFDRFVKFGLLEAVNPVDIEVKEYKWMHKLNTFQPVGINVEYPFGIPFLGQN